MNYETLRVLFESLCDYLEDDSDRYHFHFQGGFGFESPQEVVMVFIFDQLTLVFRFPASLFEWTEEAPSTKNSISVDECLSMTEALRSFSGGFQDLFSSSSSE
ncbi:MAG: hypothetical protein AB7J40_04405 [Candidatus Altimarinota bacterium]